MFRNELRDRFQMYILVNGCACVQIRNVTREKVSPSWTSMPSALRSSRSFWISSLSSRMSLALASSLTTALHTMALALSAYLFRYWLLNELLEY